MPTSFIRFTAKQSVKIVQRKFEKLRRKIPLISRLRIYTAMVKIRKAMKTPGLPITYPVQWDSSKQRKAFFATKGTFIRGYTGPSMIPTRRTDAYLKAWKVIKLQGDVDGYAVGNPLSHASFIGGGPRSFKGTTQSRIHRGRWPLFSVTWRKVIEKLPKAVRDGLRIEAIREGMKTKP